MVFTFYEQKNMEIKRKLIQQYASLSLSFNQQMQIFILGEIVGCEIEYLLIGKFLLLSFI
jgi:hypothetical protein